MTANAEKRIVEAIEAAEEIPQPPLQASAERPRLLIEVCNPDRSVAGLRDILAATGGLYDRGVPVRLAFDRVRRRTARCTRPMPVCRARSRSCISTGAASGGCRC